MSTGHSPSPAAIARATLRAAATATLATLDRASGHPFASLVQTATMPDGAPILLVSSLAQHTRNLVADGRASLLVDSRETPGQEPLTLPRVTLVGTARPVLPQETALARARYLARHPGAAMFADFSDFGYWRLDVESGHLIQGFGRIVELAAADIIAISACVNATAEQEVALIAALNGRLGGTGLAVGGIDVDGVDVRTDAGDRARLTFQERCTEFSKLLTLCEDAVANYLKNA